MKVEEEAAVATDLGRSIRSKAANSFEGAMAINSGYSFQRTIITQK